MGCCETRATGKDGMGKGFDLNDEERTLVKNYQDLNLLKEYLERLCQVTGWEVLVCKEDVVVEACERSIFTGQVPVVMGWVYLDFKAPLVLLEQLIVYRRDWDLTIEKAEMIETQENFKKFKIVQKFPLKNRVFFVKVFRFEYNGMLTFLTVNDSTEVNLDDSLELGWHHFSLIRVKDLGDKVIISHLFQIDSNFESKAFMKYILGNQLFEWLSNIRQKSFEIYQKVC
jgi:hypothetical protein